MTDGSDPGADVDLGYAGLLLSGMTPRQAWDVIRADCAEPEAAAIFANLRESEVGRRVIECAAQAWDRHGMPVPWEPWPGEEATP